MAPVPDTDRIAREHEGRLYAELVRALRGMQEDANISAYIRALEQGNVDAALKALQVDTLPDRLING